MCLSAAQGIAINNPADAAVGPECRSVRTTYWDVSLLHPQSEEDEELPQESEHGEEPQSGEPASLEGEQVVSQPVLLDAAREESSIGGDPTGALALSTDQSGDGSGVNDELRPSDLRVTDRVEIAMMQMPRIINTAAMMRKAMIIEDA